MFPLFQNNWLGVYVEKDQVGIWPSVSNGYLRFPEASVILRAITWRLGISKQAQCRTW